jgi:uncharacterized protein (DUF4415 family)
MLAKAAPPTASKAATNARWDQAVAVNGGGISAVRGALARRTRGPNRNPTKVSMTIRLTPDTLKRWKASGPGWQTRMAEALDKLPLPKKGSG